jgi:hypothetical protein
LDATYHFSALHHNADVIHLWCALLVRNRSAARYMEVRRFLAHHREAMGLFLYPYKKKFTFNFTLKTTIEFKSEKGAE